MSLLSAKNLKKIILVSTLVFFLFFIFTNLVFAQDVPGRPAGAPSNSEYDSTSGLWCYTETVIHGSGANTVVLQERKCYDDSSETSTIERSADGGDNFTTKATVNPSSNSNNDFFSCNYILYPSAGCVFFSIGYIIGLIASFIFYLGGILIGFSLNLNSQVLGLSVVHAGWTFTRDIANLGFILAIIIISFGIIIRIEEYGSMKTLRSLIVAALLVNFSLVIAGIILDFAGILTTFFANIGLADGQGINEFTQNLAQITQIDTLNTIRPDVAITLTDFGTNLTSQILSLFFLLLFTVLAAIVFMGIAVMLLIRFIWVAILLIVMPISFLSSIFPKSRSLTSLWWNKFIQWTFFPVTSMFFLSLAVESLLDKNKENIGFLSQSSDGEGISTTAQASTQLAGALKDSSILSGGVDNIVTMLIVLGFLTASITVGFAGSIKGAQFARNWAQGVKGWTINKAKRGATRVAKSAGRTATQTFGIEEGVQKLADATSSSPVLSRIPLLNKLTASAAISTSKLSSVSSRTETDIRKKEFKDVDKDNIANYYNATDAQGRAALIEIAAEKGWLNKLPKIDYNAYNRYQGDKKKLSEKDILISEDKKDDKNIIKSLQTSDPTKRVDAFSKAITEKIRSMKPEDFGKVMWGDVLDGKNIRKISGIDIEEDEWKKTYQPQILKAISENTYGKEFGNILKKSSARDRNEIANKTLIAALDLDNNYTEEELKQRSLFDILPDKIKEDLKNKNKSLYNYFKNSLHSAGGDDAGEAKEKETGDKGDKKEDK